MKRAALFVIRAFQLALSPFLGKNCRFYPSCSHYAGEAFRTKSFSSALRLSLLRILKCHPFSPGGYDPVPGASQQEPL